MSPPFSAPSQCTIQISTYLNPTYPKHFFKMRDLKQLMRACRSGNVPAVKSIVSNRPGLAESTDDRGETPFILAINSNQMPVAQALLDEGAYVDGRNGEWNTALMIAAKKGYPEQIRFLLEYGASVNAQNLDGTPPLTLAILAGKPFIVEMLLKAGADPELKDHQGLSPEYYARHHGSSDIRKVMGLD